MKADPMAIPVIVKACVRTVGREHELRFCVVEQCVGRRSMRLESDRIDARIRTPTAGYLKQTIVDLFVVEIDGHDARVLTLREFETIWIVIDDRNLLGTEKERRLNGELSDRSESDHGQCPVGRHIGVLHSLPGGRQDVREVQEPLVRRTLRDRDRPELGLRDPQQLGLAPRDRPVQGRVAEQ